MLRQIDALRRKKAAAEKALDEKRFGGLLRKAQEEGAEPWQKKCLWINSELDAFVKRIRDGDFSEASLQRYYALIAKRIGQIP